MKRGLNVMLLFAMVVTFSCNDDDGGGSHHHNFKDQDVSGKIANVSWSYQDGYADIYDGGEEMRIDVSLVLAQTETACDILLVDGDQVFFNLPSETGLYTLKLDWNAPENSYTATLFDTEETMNYIAATGAIEILSISDTEVSGRIDAKVDGENFVNGNFTVSICQ